MQKTLIAGIAMLVAVSCAIGVRAGRGTELTAEQEIRQVDAREAEAVLRGDYETIDRLWAADIVVNNPFNMVVEGAKGPIRTGALTYASFERQVESVQVHGDTAIVMGNEVVVPKGSAPDAGKTIHRRYTNLWMKRDGAWRLTARHANVVCG